MSTLELLDRKIFIFLNSGISNPVFDRIMPFVTARPWLLLVPAFLILIYIMKGDRLRAALLPLLGLLLTDGLTNILKELIKRHRPFLEVQDVFVLVGKGGSYSMPSAHASNVAAVSLVMGYLFWKWTDGRARTFGIAYLALSALMVSFSRIYVGVHYPSDVIAGMGLGMLTGAVLLYAVSLYERNLRYSPERTVLYFVLLAVSLFRIYYILAGPLDLSPDEAQYWDWSRHLDLSYYSKGPGIAWIIALSTGIFGDNPFGVRFPAVLFSLFSSLMLFALTRDMAIMNGLDKKRADKAGLVAALTLQTIPLFSAYGIVNTIDSPLIFLWTASLFLFVRIYKSEMELRRAGIHQWAGLGLLIGAGFLVKYTMVFFILSGLLFFLSNSHRRRYLAMPGPWISVVFFMIAVSPVIIWNARHGWVSLLHTAGQAHLSEGFTIKPLRFLEFLGSQIGVVTPVIFGGLFVSLFTTRRRWKETGIGVWFMLPTFVFFLLKSLQGKVQANWALPAYISGIALMGLELAKGWQGYGRLRRVTVYGGFVLAVLITVLSHYPSLIDLPPRLDPSSRLRGWEELGVEVSRITEKLERPFFIFSDRYQITSELAFYVKGNPVTYCINRGRRMNQYDLWPGFHELKGYNAVFVTYGDTMPRDLASLFDGIERRVFKVKEGDRVLRTYTILIGRGFRGMKKRPFERF